MTGAHERFVERERDLVVVAVVEVRDPRRRPRRGERVTLTVTPDDGRVRIDVHATGAAPPPPSSADHTISSRDADSVTDTWARASEHGTTDTWAEFLC